MSLLKVLGERYPGRPWCLWTPRYEDIQWKDIPESERMTKEEVETRLRDLLHEKAFDTLRAERNRRLAECDYLFVADYPHPSPESKTAWATYRQALRDLPATVVDPENPVWPTHI